MTSAEVVVSWESSDRRSRLPADWSERRQATKARARDRCEATTHDPRCDGWGSECDHRTPGDDHDLANLQWLNPWCHKAKTQREAQAAKPKRKRPPERHPGAIT